MKKKNWIQILKKTLIIFVMIVFSVFSTGFLVSVHECCHAHKHDVCQVHQPAENEHETPSSELNQEGSCCENESASTSNQTSNEELNHLEGCSCNTHNHCLVLTFLIKITDNFVVSDLLKNQLKSPTPIALFSSLFSDFEYHSLPEESRKEHIYAPPKTLLGGKTFIIFTSQRVYYA